MSNQSENTENKDETSTETVSESVSESGGCWSAFKGLLILGGLVIVLVAMCSNEEEQIAEEQNSKVFPFTVNEFVSRYNRSADKLEMDHIAVYRRKALSNGTEYYLTKAERNGRVNQYGLSVTTDKNSDRVRSIYYRIFIVSKETTLELPIRYTLTIMAVENPYMSPQDGFKRLSELGVKRSIDNKQEITTRKNNIVYKVDNMLESIGAITLSIKPDKEE